ncbi:MAG: hypothetical protein JSR18_14060 [Proteobacteria bacterium]|nr:hypothetical protein [Pseudomonadota bacterium]
MGTHQATLVVQTDGTPSSLRIALSGTGVDDGSAVGDTVPVIEYYHTAFDHYFMTSDPTEQAALGKAPFEDWQPTGRSFNAFAVDASAPASAEPVCRFFNASFAPKSSHFYALPETCAQTLTAFPDWQLEKPEAFALYVPTAAGQCPDGSVPVYRLYNNGQGGAPNHRFVTSLDDRAAMLAAGWVSEGAGPLGIGMCAPQ